MSANPFAPPEAELESSDDDRSEGHRLDPQAWPRERDRAIGRLALLGALAMTAALLSGSGGQPVRSRLIAGGILAVGLATVAAVSLGRQAQRWRQLRYRLEGDRLVVTGGPLPVSIPKADIRRLQETDRGLQVTGRDYGQSVLIPRAVLGYPALRDQLADWRPFDAAGGWSALRRYALPLVLLVLVYGLAARDQRPMTWVMALVAPIALLQAVRVARSRALPAGRKVLLTMLMIYVGVVGMKAILRLASGESWPW